jgi:hypothetical protein
VADNFCQRAVEALVHTPTPEENGDTLLTGSVIDQAALHGLLKMLRD